MAEYGRIAIFVYLAIFAASLVGFATAIEMGFEVDGAAATTGLWGAAWLATKVIQPLRIGGTLVLTPIVATVVRRRPALPDGDSTPDT